MNKYEKLSIVILSAKSQEALKREVMQLVATIKKNKIYKLNLCDVAYTLQVGREAMENRLALIVNSFDELEEKLEAFLDDQKDIEFLYKGNIEDISNENVLLIGDDTEKIIDAWIENESYEKIARAWISGCYINWTNLYKTTNPNRVSLPTYPFAREKYWYENNNIKVRSNIKLHPLVHDNISDLLEQRFYSEFTGEEFFLADHLINGQRVLSGVVQMEMGLFSINAAAKRLVNKDVRIILQNITWLKPIIIKNKLAQIYTKIISNENGEITYKICSELNDNSDISVEYSQGNAIFCELCDNESIDIKLLKKQCNIKMYVKNEAYKILKNIGAEYGDSYQAIQEVYIGEGQGLAKLELPHVVLDTIDDFTIHPSLIDAALQAAVLVIFAYNENIRPAIPFSLEQFEVLGKCTEHMWAYIKDDYYNELNDKTMLKFDIIVCNENADVAFKIKGLLLRNIVQEEHDEFMFEPIWNKYKVFDKNTVVNYYNRVIFIFDLHEVDIKYIKSQIKDSRCIFLKQKKLRVDEKFKTYIIEIFKNIQNNFKEKSERNVLIQVIVPSNEENIILSAFIGIIKTMNIENPDFIGQLIELDKQDYNMNELIHIIEYCSKIEKDHVKYKNHEYLVHSWRRIDSVPKNKELPWKNKGVYLITGGTGGLGLIIAKEIVHKVKNVVLILVGRSVFTDKKKELVNNLISIGTTVEYKQVDVANKEEVIELVQYIKNKFENLNGIIHAAGIIKDNFIFKKTEKEILSVLNPKVTGLVNIDEITSNIKMDFFIIFSSTSGCFGNLGQADYSAANAFMDMYSLYRNELRDKKQRYGQTLSIDWSLWKNGGMHIDEEYKKMLKNKTGIIEMDNCVAIKALYSAFNSQRSQVMVLVGVVGKIKSLVSEESNDSKTLKLTAAKTESDKCDGDIDYDLYERAIIYFKELFSSVIKLPPDKIKVDVDIEKYGIDSIMIMKITDKLEVAFGKISRTVLFEHRNIELLVKYFLENYHGKLEDLLNYKKEIPNLYNYQISKAYTKMPVTKNKARCFENLKSDSLIKKENKNLDIAIIGLSGRYARAQNIDEFWDNLKNGVNCITEIPKGRWNNDIYFNRNKNIYGKTYSKWGGFIDNIDEFDSLFFNISPRQAEIMDPQERLFLQCVYELLEDSGYVSNDLVFHNGLEIENNVGVYVGVMYSEYQLYGAQEMIKGRPMALSGSYSSIANRVSYFFNFNGPSIALDTMCSSSLTALHLACEALKAGECKQAIVGGVNLSIHPNKYLLLSQGKFVSEKGLCQSFGEGGDGYVPGEGIGAVLLKPLSRAIADNDNIYGVIKSTAINHGGKTNGYTVPNSKAQAKVISEALKKSHINPRTISYVEAHGTGTELGDPIEIQGLTNAFKQYTDDKQFCSIGSVKSNIGHCESASGIAALTKVLLQIKYHKLVPSLHSKNLNHNIKFSDTPFVVQHELTEWERPLICIDGQKKKFPRRAGISCFGAGGSNAHVIIEEYIEKEHINFEQVINNREIIILSAQSRVQLHKKIQMLMDFICNNKFSEERLIDIAYTLQVGREMMSERLALIVTSMEELKEKLQKLLDGKKTISNVYKGTVNEDLGILDILKTDIEAKKMIVKWIDDGKYEKVLQLWTRGINFDWNKLYSVNKPHRISLPCYPFAKERHWIPNFNYDKDIAQKDIKYNEFDVNNEEIKICVKEWTLSKIASERQNKFTYDCRVLVILGTKMTMKLSSKLFENNSNIIVINAIHGEEKSNSQYIFTDFYSESSGELLYKKINELKGNSKLIGVIDITAYDKTYENSVELESGKIVFLQKLVEYNRNDEYKLLQVTYKLQNFDIPQSSMQGARIVGLYKMLGAEYKQICSMTMDSDYPIENYEKLSQIIEKEFLYEGFFDYTECCYRDNLRYEPKLVTIKEKCEIQRGLHTNRKYEKDEVVIITGGTGGIGRSIAESIALEGIKNIVIFGRENLPKESEWENILSSQENQLNKISDLTKEKIKFMQKLIYKGVNVLYCNVPLTNYEDISKVIDKIHCNKMKVIGVFHCAGTTSENPAFFRKSLIDINAVCQPKMKGLVNLHKAVKFEPLEFFILFSSISSISPILAVGQSDYSMANAYMDYYALNQVHKGKRYMKAIQWPLWKDSKMGASNFDFSVYFNEGLTSISTENGIALLNTIKEIGKPLALVYAAVLNKVDCNELLKVKNKVSLNNKSKEKIEIDKSMLNKSREEKKLRLNITKWLQDIFASQLKLRVDQINPHKSFDQYGIDSVILAELVNKMKDKLHKNIDPSLLFQYNTMDALVDYFECNYAKEFVSFIGNNKADDYVNDIKQKGIEADTLDKSKENFQTSSKFSNEKMYYKEDIAVVGISCNLPGAPTRKEYWELLKRGEVAIKLIPDERNIFKSKILNYGGWLNDIYKFDARFFNINEEDAAIMDPQSRLILEESLKAIYDAGYNHKLLAGKAVGVYIGGRLQLNTNIKDILKAPNPILGMGQNYLATNISKYFDFKGPSMVVDTACSSGLTSMSLAVQSLQLGNIDGAVVGAVSLLTKSYAHEMFAARNILNRDREFRIFDKNCNGEILGEGAGIVILKRLSDAIRDGNKIYGVIKAISSNNDGKTPGYGSPNISAEKQVIESALRMSKRNLEDIGYIEVNGAGSLVMDAIELKALSDVYKLDNKKLATCVLGSIKPNVGHLLLASGLAGFIRCVLSVYYKQIPPFLSALDPFEYYNFSTSRIKFNRETINWEIEEGKKRISAQDSFADGGTNCHVIIEEFIPSTEYNQCYFTKPVPNMNKKYLNNIQVSSNEYIESNNFKTKIEANNHSDMKNAYKNLNQSIVNKNQFKFKNFWGEYNEKDL